MEEKLLPDKIKQRLKTKTIGKKIVTYEETGSTNDIAHILADAGEKEGSCIFAEKQTKGRGRLGRHWISPRGTGIYLSIILRPKINPHEAPRITLVAAVAIAKALKKACGKQVSIKWPNDILLNGKKVCGILTEMNAEMDAVKFIILGIGINVNTKHGDLPKHATSLGAECRKKISRIELACYIISELDKYYSIFKKGRFENIIEEWRELSSMLGKHITVACHGEHNKKMEGYAYSVDEYGSLILRLDSGFLKTINSGEVTILR